MNLPNEMRNTLAPIATESKGGVLESTRGRDEVIAKSPIWLKLYQMNIWNPSRKDQKSFLQNMN